MKRMLKMMTAVLALGGLMAIGGCGSDEANPIPPNPKVEQAVAVDPTKTTPTSVVTSTAQTVTVSSGASVVLPAAATIATTGGAAMPANPVIKVESSVNGVSGVPQVTSGGTTLTLSNSAGAVNVEIETVKDFTITPAAGGAVPDVIIPVTNATGLVGNTSVLVDVVKASGRTYKTNGTVSADLKTVKVAGVTDFCWFIVNPKWLTPTGSTGSTGQ